MNQDLDNTLSDIAEMAHEHYICTVSAYNAENGQYEITWVNNEGRECGFWAKRELVEQMFTEAIFN